MSGVEVRRANTILYCADLAAMLGFYRDVLGLTVSLDREWFVEFRLGPDSFVSIADAERTTIRPGSGAGLTLTWQVDDVAADRAALVARGVECTPLTSRWGSQSTYLRDPEGNRIELWTPRD